MKLLLTSQGLNNDQLKDAFCRLLPEGKPLNEIKLAFIPTAAKNELNPDWLDKSVAKFRSLGIDDIDMLDISEVVGDDLMARLEKVDAIFVEGGDVYFLRDHALSSGFADALPKLLETKLYVGASAGSKLLNPDISVAALYYDPHKNPEGLGLVDFCIVPHMGNAKFPNRAPDKIEPLVEKLGITTYLLDDDSAIVVDGSLMQIVGGQYVEFRK